MEIMVLDRINEKAVVGFTLDEVGALYRSLNKLIAVAEKK